MGDFREAIYYPVRAFTAGDNPYDTFAYIAKYPVDQIFPPYSPLTLLLHLPFGLLPVHAGEIAYFGFTIALTLVLAALALRGSGLRAGLASVLMLASVVLASRPGHWNLLVGQSTLELVLAAYLALYVGRDRPWLAALGLMLATIKPTYGAPVALLMVAQRQWRALVLGCGLTAAATLVPVLVLVQAGGVDAFIEALRTSYANFASQGTVDPATSPVRVDVLALAARLLGAPLPKPWQLVLTGIVLGLGALGVSRASQPEHGQDGRRLALLLGSLTVLTASYQQSYNTLLLAAPIVAVAADRWAPPPWQRPAIRLALLGLLALPAVNYLASYSGATAIGRYPTFWLIAVSANGAALFVAYLLCVVTSFGVTPTRTRRAHAERSFAHGG